MRTLVVGDIHGAHKALVQCLERSGFDKRSDQLITIGDICDGWPDVAACVDELLTVENRIDVRGNHDDWFNTWLNTGIHPDPRGSWSQGGAGTCVSYGERAAKTMEDRWTFDAEGERAIFRYCVSLVPSDIPELHIDFFRHQIDYYIDTERNMCFVHGGYYRLKGIKETARENWALLYWDRELWQQALCCDKRKKLKTKENFEAIFIGHTATTNWSTKEEYTNGGIILPAGAPITVPMYAAGVWNLDTGAGWNGKLTIMDVDTKEFWQSDFVPTLYPEEAARKF